ncbi:MAG: hypothetical protein AAFV45_00635 [Pseudomonadota bacterium]
MTTPHKDSIRFDDISSWLLEQIGLARLVNECDEAARSLLDDAERELAGLCADFTSVKLADGERHVTPEPSPSIGDPGPPDRP